MSLAHDFIRFHFVFRGGVAQKVHQSHVAALKCAFTVRLSDGCREVRKSFVGRVLIAAAVLSTPALGADIAPLSVARGPIIGGFDWEGFYVGGHVGGATDSVNFAQTDVSWSGCLIAPPAPAPCGLPLPLTSVNTGESGSLGATSITGGAQMGYNWLLP